MRRSLAGIVVAAVAACGGEPKQLAWCPTGTTTDRGPSLPWDAGPVDAAAETDGRPPVPSHTRGPVGWPDAHQVERARIEAVRELARRGVDAFRAGRFAEALELFARADGIAPVPPVLLYEARCLAALGFGDAAREVYDALLASPLPVDASPAWRQARADAQAERKLLDADPTPDGGAESWPDPSEGTCVDLPKARPTDFWAKATTIAFPRGEDGHVALPSGALVFAQGSACPAQRWTEVECRPLAPPAADALYAALKAAHLPDLKRRTAAGPRFSWLGVVWVSVHAAGQTCDVVVSSNGAAGTYSEASELAARIDAAR